MLLRNYDICMASILSSYKEIPDIKAKGVTGVDLSTGSICSSNCVPPMLSFATDMKYAYSTLHLGEDDTPVTYDDYRLGNYHTLTSVSMAAQTPYLDDNNCVIAPYMFVYCNSTDSPVTIKDLCVTYRGINTPNQSYSFMVYREVLDNPIEVPVGANVVITLNRKISLISNQPVDYVATASVE